MSSNHPSNRCSGFVSGTKDLRDSFCNGMVVSDTSAIPAKWQSSYSKTCVERHPGFCRSSVAGSPSFDADLQCLCRTLSRWPIGSLIGLIGTIEIQDADKRGFVFYCLLCNNEESAVLAQVECCDGGRLVLKTSSRGAEFRMVHSVLLEIYQLFDKRSCEDPAWLRAPSTLHAVLYRDVVESLLPGDSVAELAGGLPLRLQEADSVQLLPRRQDRQPPKPWEPSSSYLEMQAILRALMQPSKPLAVDFGDFTDEGVKDAEAIESLEAEFARHLHAARAVRNKKVKSGKQAQNRKRKAARHPVPVPDSRAADAAAAPLAAPRETGGWRVAALGGFGWVKWNPETGKMDAHCARHKGCKADRRAKVGPLGMQALWLQSCCEDRSLRSSHVLAKSEVSGLDFFDARCRARAWVHTLAETDQKVADLLADEAASRDGPFFCLVDACLLCSQKNVCNAYYVMSFIYEAKSWSLHLCLARVWTPSSCGR